MNYSENKFGNLRMEQLFQDSKLQNNIQGINSAEEAQTTYEENERTESVNTT